MDGRSGAIISGWAMDLLVVAAITTLDLQAVATYWVPMTLLFLGGAVWSAFCLLVLSRRILPQSHWFELGLINYGMSTGTTATGFVLLRLVDPQLRTDAAKHYAFAAPLSAPMVGGGLVTIGLPLLLLQRLPIAASALAISVFVAGLIVVALRLGRNQ
jgi:ESS family glutamate:Na+ symporter